MYHPLDILSEKETDIAREVISAAYPGSVLFFREIYLEEPTKAELIPYLELEHSGKLSPTSPRPRRLAKCQYDVVGSERVPEFHDDIVDVEKRQRVSHTVVGKQHHATLTLYVPDYCGRN
jgi:primary-amine oxidase